MNSLFEFLFVVVALCFGWLVVLIAVIGTVKVIRFIRRETSDV